MRPDLAHHPDDGKQPDPPELWLAEVVAMILLGGIAVIVLGCAVQACAG